MHENTRDKHKDTVTIRPATDDDYDALWDIFHRVIKTGDTYVFRPATPKEDLSQYWMAPYMQTLGTSRAEQSIP